MWPWERAEVKPTGRGRGEAAWKGPDRKEKSPGTLGIHSEWLYGKCSFAALPFCWSTTRIPLASFCPHCWGCVQAHPSCVQCRHQTNARVVKKKKRRFPPASESASRLSCPWRMRTTSVCFYSGIRHPTFSQVTQPITDCAPPRPPSLSTPSKVVSINSLNLLLSFHLPEIKSKSFNGLDGFCHGCLPATGSPLEILLEFTATNFRR